MTNTPPRTRAEAKAVKGRPSKSGKRRSGWRVWGLRALWASLVLGLLGIIGVGVAYSMVKVPDPNEIATAQTSIVYYADGEEELARLSDPEGNRESVPLDQISPNMQHAIIAAEDQTFYENSGISPKGIARAVWVAIKGGGETSQGGSTITQQYVKNFYLTQDRTLTRKAKEILLSIKISQQDSKDQILENYLNTIYYGRGAYGIETAAKAYFGTSAAELDASQSAFLATVIRGPSLYDPSLGEDQRAYAQERWGYILDAEVDLGYLTAGERSGQVFPEVNPYEPPQLSGPEGYIVDMVKRELLDKHALTESDIQRGGLRVISTIDKPKQQAAIDAVDSERPSAKDIHVGLASLVPGDGAIEALYGGQDYSKRQLNNATQATMQAGSTFKIFTLIAGLEKGDLSTKTRFSGRSPQFFEEFADPNADNSFGRRGGVSNFGNENFGSIDMLTATQHSVNTVYAAANILVGAENTMKAAATAGVKSELQPNLADVLGTDYVTVMDMATAYATIAAEGVRAEPYIVKEIRFQGDLPSITAEPKTERVFEADLMSDVIDALQRPTEEGGTAQYVGRNLGRPAAGKTGTSESFRSAWFDGFVPQLGAAVGMYRAAEDGSELPMENLPEIGDITGGTFPARIWTAYMKTALDGVEVVDFPKPAHINKKADTAVVSTPPPSPTPSSTPTPSQTPTPSDTPEPTPSDTPTPSDPPPTEPPPTTQPPPTEPPPTTEPPGGGNGGGGNGGGGGGAPAPTPSP